MRSIAAFTRDIIAAILNRPTSWDAQRFVLIQGAKAMEQKLWILTPAPAHSMSGQRDGNRLCEIVSRAMDRGGYLLGEDRHELCGICARMPRTANGVPFMAGDTISVPGRDGTIHQVEARISVTLPAATPSHAGTFNPQPAPAAPAG